MLKMFSPSPSRPSRAALPAERPPLCVNQTNAVKLVGSPALLKDLEADGLVVPLNQGKPKWYSVVNLQRAVLEKVRRNQTAQQNGSLKQGFFCVRLAASVAVLVTVAGATLHWRLA